ncbi:uncharacterized protein LOC141717854 isoform X2 [Apium graveolens]|uniref:uncharacterized protein LOC141717854 isoform X2 n=1 Tax=Apium graveolens TaxID=4045 RepID=UPI003D7B3303
MAPNDNYVQVGKKKNKFLILAKPLLKVKGNSVGATTPPSRKEAQTEKDNLLAVTKKEQVAGTEEEQLFYHDPSIKYKPLSRYIVPKFAFSDTSSTDWSESTDSESDTELMAEEATRGQKEKIRDDTRVERLFCNDLAKSPSTDFQSVAEDLTKSSSANLQSKSSV